MTIARSTPNWIIAVIVIGAVLYWLRAILAPLGLAVVLWLAIDSLARSINRLAPSIPKWLALLASLTIVVCLAFVVVSVFAQNATAVAANASQLEPRLDSLAEQLQTALGAGGEPWTVRGLVAQIGPTAMLGGVAAVAQDLAANAALIGLYLLFLFPASAAFSRKMPELAPDPHARAQIEMVFTSIRRSIETYFQVQTTVSLMISVLSWATLLLIGVPNALFWSFLIFFLNYIPNIGSIIAVLLPTLFTLVQFPDWQHAAAVAVGLQVWQFGIGTFVQPRMTGASVNLSTLVVVLSLALWGTLWGVIGVFLAVPLMVMLMIVLEQFPGTHWIAVLLSANGRPAPLLRSEGAVAVATHEPSKP